MEELREYEVTLTVRVQTHDPALLPDCITEALTEHDLWPMYVRSLDDGEEFGHPLYIPRPGIAAEDLAFYEEKEEEE